MCFNRRHAEQIYSKKKIAELHKENDKSWFVYHANKKQPLCFNVGKSWLNPYNNIFIYVCMHV